MLILKKKPLRQFRLLKLELGRLRRLYDACVFSFATTGGVLQQQLTDGTITGGTTISVPGKSERVLAWSPLELFKRMKDVYPGVLRESLLVRAVSQMENYLVEMLTEISRRSLDPFKQQDKMLNFTQAHLLSFETAEQLRSHLIEGECRGLNGKGFREFEKYYKKRFNIEFSQAPVFISEIEEIYARRHILVHAGGQVDDTYCRRFAQSMKPGERLDIGEDYFLSGTRKLESLAEFCAGRVEVLFPDPTDPVAPPIERLLQAYGHELHRRARDVSEGDVAVAHWFSATFDSVDLLDDHFSEESSFGFGPTKMKVSSLIVGQQRISDTTMHWLICAPKRTAGAYIGYLAYMERRGMLAKFEKHHIASMSPEPNGSPETDAPESGAPLG